MAVRQIQQAQSRRCSAAQLPSGISPPRRSPARAIGARLVHAGEMLDETDAKLVALAPKDMAFPAPSGAGDSQHEFVGNVVNDDAGDFCATSREILDDARTAPFACAIIDESGSVPLESITLSTLLHHGRSSLPDFAQLSASALKDCLKDRRGCEKSLKPMVKTIEASTIAKLFSFCIRQSHTRESILPDSSMCQKFCPQSYSCVVRPFPPNGNHLSGPEH